jgi:RNase P subunit RPR2
MTERSRSKPDFQVRIAKERIDILFDEAAKAPDDLARRYIKLAKKIGMRYNVKIGPERKKTYCKHCFTPFGAAGAKLRKGFLIRKCRHCERVTKIKFK